MDPPRQRKDLKYDAVVQQHFETAESGHFLFQQQTRVVGRRSLGRTSLLENRKGRWKVTSSAFASGIIPTLTRTSEMRR